MGSCMKASQVEEDRKISEESNEKKKQENNEKNEEKYNTKNNNINDNNNNKEVTKDEYGNIINNERRQKFSNLYNPKENETNYTFFNTSSSPKQKKPETNNEEEGNKFFKEAKAPNISHEKKKELFLLAKTNYEIALKSAKKDDDIASCNKNLGITCLYLAELEFVLESRLKYWENGLQYLENAYIFGNKIKNADWIKDLLEKAKKITKETVKDLRELPQEIRTDKYMFFYQRISNDFTDAKAIFTVNLIGFLFGVYLVEKNQKKWKNCLSKLIELEGIVKGGISFANKNKYANKGDLEEIKDYEERVFIENCSCQAYIYYDIAKKNFNVSINEKENIDMDLIYQTMDDFKQTIINAKGKDIELEAKASQKMGTISWVILKKIERARQYFHDAVTLGISLAPRDVSQKKWFKKANQSLQEIQKIIANEEDKKKEEKEAPFREKNKELLEKIEENSNKNWQTFLTYILNNCQPKADTNNYKLDDEKLKSANMKKTLQEVLRFYHPDKQSNFSEEWQFISREITKYLTRFYELSK